jgi:hypothetical protein
MSGEKKYYLANLPAPADGVSACWCEAGRSAAALIVKAATSAGCFLSRWSKRVQPRDRICLRPITRHFTSLAAATAKRLGPLWRARTIIRGAGTLTVKMHEAARF